MVARRVREGAEVSAKPAQCACFRVLPSRRRWMEHRRRCLWYRFVRRFVTGREAHKYHDMSAWRNRRAEYLSEKGALVPAKPASGEAHESRLELNEESLEDEDSAIVEQTRAVYAKQ